MVTGDVYGAVLELERRSVYVESAWGSSGRWKPTGDRKIGAVCSRSRIAPLAVQQFSFLVDVFKVMASFLQWAHPPSLRRKKVS